MEDERKLHHRSRWNLLHLKMVHGLKVNYLEVSMVGSVGERLTEENIGS